MGAEGLAVDGLLFGAVLVDGLGGGAVAEEGADDPVVAAGVDVGAVVAVVDGDVVALA